ASHRIQKRFSIADSVLRLRTFPRGVSQFQETLPKSNQLDTSFPVSNFLQQTFATRKTLPFPEQLARTRCPLSHSRLRPGNSFHIPLFPVCPCEDFKMKFLIYFVLGFLSSTPGNSFHIPLFPVCPREDFKMKFLIYLVLGFLSSTPGKASCPGRYKSVSYQLGSQRQESCYFVSTDYIRWADGAEFCSRHHGGYLAEFVYLAEWEAFKTFIANIPETTKDELYDAEHVWIGAAIVDGNAWKWNGSGEDFSQIFPKSQIPQKTPLNDLPQDGSYGLTVNVHSGEMVPYKLGSAYYPGSQTMHSYVCETDQPMDKEDPGVLQLSRNLTKCQRDLGRKEKEVKVLRGALGFDEDFATTQNGSRDLVQCHEDLDDAEEKMRKMSENLTECERELKKRKEQYQSLVYQALVQDNILSQNLTECRTDLGRKEREVKALRVALGIEDDSGTEDLPRDLVECQENITEIKDVLSLKEQTILSVQGELEKTEEALRRERGRISALEGELRALERELREEKRLNGVKISALEGELGEERRLRGTKEEMISKQQELLVVKEERTAALESELREERRLNGVKISALESELREERRLRATKDAKISALEEKNSLLEDELEEHSRHCFPGSMSFPQEGVMTVTKRELQNLVQPGASPQPPSLTIGEWTMQLFMTKETNLFLVVTHCGRVDQAYALTFQVDKVWEPSSRTYTGEYFDQRRRTGAVDLLSKGDLSNLLSKYEDEESFRFKVRLLEAVATDVKGNTEKNEMTFKARFANVSAMEPLYQVYSEPHFLRGFRLRLMAQRSKGSLRLNFSCIGNVLEGGYSVSVTWTVTLERDGGKGGHETKWSTITHDRRTVVLGWNFVKWEELVAPRSGWIGEDGSVSVSSTVKINE
ncbi:unnamed protein product, partial [Cyprideis torosa]